MCMLVVPIYCNDMKMNYLLLGMSAGAGGSTYACPYCYCRFHGVDQNSRNCTQAVHCCILKRFLTLNPTAAVSAEYQIAVSRAPHILKNIN